MGNEQQTWDLFIAHAGPDLALAKQLYALVHTQVKTFLDSECVKLGDDWDAMLSGAQSQTLVSVVLVSTNTDKAYYQREEIAAAIAMARKDAESHRVVPIFVGKDGEEAAIPYGLRLKHGIILSDELNLEDAADRLIELVHQLRSSAGALAGKAAAAKPAGQRGMFHAPTEMWASPVQQNNWRYKVVAFDLDGTLLRGADFVFSWERVWSELKVAKSVQKELRNEYKLKAEGAVTPDARIAAYRKWCEAAVAHFRRRGLTRKRLTDIAGTLRLTANCREALGKLRQAGIVTAIISGGINTFLEDCFPDFRDYIDFVFLNTLQFDANGVVEDVEATAFDFEGKAEALKLICDRTQCTSAETAFIGDRFNDEAIMLHANLKIAYPPGDKIVGDTVDHSISEDDLTKILPLILVE